MTLNPLQIYRCSVVWDSKKLVLIVPVLLALASAGGCSSLQARSYFTYSRLLVTGYLSQYVGLMFIILSMTTNLTVTCLIGKSLDPLLFISLQGISWANLLDG